MDFKVSAVLPAAGCGQRMGVSTPKQFSYLLGRPLISYCLESFERISWVDDIIVTVSPESLDLMRDIVCRFHHKRTTLVEGASVRHRSIYNGVNALKKASPDVVVIHDAVRPFVDEETLRQVAVAAREYGIQNPNDPAHRKDSAAKGKNFLKLLKQKDVLYFLFFLWDVVTCLSKVSEAFQQREATTADVHLELETATRLLEKYKESDGPKLRNVLGHEAHKRTNLIGRIDIYNSARSQLLRELLTSLYRRFEVDSEVMQASRIIQLQMWPTKLCEHEEFGDDDVVILVNKLRSALEVSDVQCDEVEPEWTNLKCLMYHSFPDVPSLTWEQVNRLLAKKFPNVLALVDLVMSLPAGSVEAERGFSHMNVVMSDWRSCLHGTSLSDQLTVVLECPDVSAFDPSEAIHLWNTAGARSRRTTFLLPDNDSDMESDDN